MIRRAAPALMLAAFGLAACNAASDFEGKWTYQSGSTLTLRCPGEDPKVVDLANVSSAGQPSTFTFSEGMDGVPLHEVDAFGCAWDWALDDQVATASAGQSCSTFSAFEGRNQTVHLQSGTKTTMDAKTMRIDVGYTTDAGCGVAIAGTATKG
jgi:hypothetical protein